MNASVWEGGVPPSQYTSFVAARFEKRSKPYPYPDKGVPASPLQGYLACKKLPPP